MTRALPIVLALFAVVAIVVAPIVVAKAAPQGKDETTVTGTIDKVSADSCSVKDAKDKVTTSKIDAKTKITLDGKDAKAADLKTGQKAEMASKGDTATSIKATK